MVVAPRHCNVAHRDIIAKSAAKTMISDWITAANPTNPNADIKPSDAFQLACNAVLRAKIESTRILAANLRGEYHETSPTDPWFAGITAVDLPPILSRASAPHPRSGQSFSTQFTANS
jgi:hypothetical protein